MLQKQQVSMLLNNWQKSMDDVSTRERSILSLLQRSEVDGHKSLGGAELFDTVEDLLTCAALYGEIDNSLVLGLVYSVLTPFQAACFVGAAYPSRCNWAALSKQLATMSDGKHPS